LFVQDIFISFAHVDDQPFAHQEKGWITHFTNHLRNELSRKLGRKDNYSFWKDFRLQGNDAVTPEIEKQVAEAETLLILFSPGWMASPWCQKELEIFRNTHPDLSKRIFVIELDRVDLQDKPVIMQDLLNYPFWRQTDKDRVRQLGYPVPQANDSDYFERLVDLSHDLAKTLKILQATSPATPEPPKATVYVAPVDYPLYSYRANLISELGQFGIEALPSGNELDNNMDANLAKCSHFVQLLDAHYTMRVPFNQHFTAETTGKPILQWRDPKLDYTGGHVPEEQKKLLEGKTVIAAPLSDFIRMVRDAVLPKHAQPDDEPPRVNGEKMVFVHASQDDFESAYQVAQALKARGYGIALPRYQGEPERIRKSIERGYLSCDVMLVLHQKAPADVVEDYLSDARVKTLQRETKLLILICQGDGAEELYFIPPGVLPLACNSNFDTHCLEQFLAEVEA
jgi:hypothetical protein